MKNYERPMILVNEELAEGVYAASGAVRGAGTVSVSGVTLATEGNPWYKVNTYTVTIKNSGSEDSTDWSVSISVTSGTATSVKIDNSWLAAASLSGNKIIITPGTGGVITAGGSIDVPVVVAYSSDSITVE